MGAAGGARTRRGDLFFRPTRPAATPSVCPPQHARSAQRRPLRLQGAPACLQPPRLGDGVQLSLVPPWDFIPLPEILTPTAPVQGIWPQVLGTRALGDSLGFQTSSWLRATTRTSSENLIQVTLTTVIYLPGVLAIKSIRTARGTAWQSTGHTACAH